MHTFSSQLSLRVEKLSAELTDAAYRVALKHGIRDSFLEVELELWAAVRFVLIKEQSASPFSDLSHAGVGVRGHGSEAP
jgi:hypothetical protein